MGSSTTGASVRVELTHELIEQLARRAAEIVLSELRTTSSTARVAYTVETLADEIGCSAKSVRGAIARGELDARKSGARWVISSDAVARWATPSKTPTQGRRPSRRRLRDALEPGCRDA